VAVLCGSALLGWEGALIAVPLAAMLQVILEEVVVPARLARIGEPPERAQLDEPAPAVREPAVGTTGWAYTGRRPAPS
jgi:hypothetical protein